jgi:hypothetical protein
MKSLNKYDVLSIVFIGGLLILILSRFDIYPVFVDIYYHMSVMVSFDKAGGIVLWDFWEFAPEGRPHLYPPLLHCIMLFLSEGLTDTAVGKFVSFVMFPASLITVWIFGRELFSRKTGLYSIVVLSSCIEYFRLQAITSAAALVLVLVPLVFLAYEKKRYIAASVLLALCLYTHVGMGPIAVGAFALYAVLKRDTLKKGMQVLAGSLMLYAPWGIHTLLNMESLSASSPSSNFSLILIPWILGIIGLGICLKRKKEFLIPVCILVCMVPIAFTYIGRFTGHTILPLAILSGIALTYIDNRVSPSKRVVFVIGAVLVLSLFAPTIGVHEQQKRGIQPPQRQQNRPIPSQKVPGVPDMTQRAQQLRPQSLIKARSLMSTLLVMPSDSYLTSDNIQMAEIIKRNSQENEIVFIQGGSMGCFVTATTGRPQMFGMWQEVSSDYEPDPKEASVFVVDTGRRVPEQLIKVGETNKWVVYRAPHRTTVDIPNAAVGKGIVYVLLMAAAGVVVYDFVHKK